MTTITKELTEREILSHCLEYLHLCKIFCWRNNSGMIFLQNQGKTRAMKVGLPGSPDIIGITPSGRFFSIETKRKGKKLSPSQEEFKEKCFKNNGLYLLVDDLKMLPGIVDIIKNSP